METFAPELDFATSDTFDIVEVLPPAPSASSPVGESSDNGVGEKRKLTVVTTDDDGDPRRKKPATTTEDDAAGAIVAAVDDTAINGADETAAAVGTTQRRDCAPIPMRRAVSCYAMGTKYRAQFREGICRRYRCTESPVIDDHETSVASRFTNPLVNGLCAAAIRCRGHSGELSLTAMADIFLYNDAFRNLDARGLFHALKRVPIEKLSDDVEFTFEGVKRVIEQYARSRDRPPTRTVYCAFGSVFKSESICRMSYYNGCVIHNTIVRDWLSYEYNVYVGSKVYTQNEYAIDVQPVLFCERGERILRLLRDHGYASRLDELFATVGGLDSDGDGIPP